MELIKAYNKRNPMISIAKAIGIILMVVGHVYDKESWGVHFIYMFHMPLFFVLSGYFFKAPQNLKDLLKFAKKKITGLYIPYLSWTILFILLHNFLLNFEIGEITYDSKELLLCIFNSAFTFVSSERVLVGFWFLKALFSASLFLAIFLFLAKKFQLNVSHVAIISMSLVAILMLFEIANKTLLGMFLGAFFLGVGYYVRKAKFEMKLDRWTWIFLFCSFVFILSRIFCNIHDTEMLFVDKYTFLPFSISGTLGSVMVMLISQRVVSYKNSKMFGLIRYIGDHTLIILALHYPLIKIFDFYFILNINGLNSIRLISGGGDRCLVSNYLF